MPWPRTLWLVQMLILGTVFVDKTSAEVTGRMQPHQIFVEAGGRFQVSCTMHGAPQGVTSADLAFRWNDDEMIPEIYVQLPNATTAVLLLPEVSRKYHRSYLFCIYPNNEGREDVALDGIFTIVGNKPMAVENISTTAQNWENLTISWTKKDNPTFTTKVQAYWKLNGDPSFKKCGHQKTPAKTGVEYSCWVNLRQLDLLSNSFFLIKINSSNIIGNFTTQEKIYYVHDINKPNRVKSLASSNRGTDWVELTWQSPAANRSLIYDIQVSCLQSGQKQEHVVTIGPTANLNITKNITSLQPGTSCSMTVSSTSSTPGSRWSEAVPIRLRLKDTLPSELPQTTQSGFDVNIIDGTLRHITVYWKPLTFSGGRIREYKVTAISTANDEPASSVIFKESSVNLTPKSNVWTFKNQDLNKTYNISVLARTSAGYNPSLQPREPIIVLPQTQLPPTPENVTAIVNAENVTEVRWTPTPGARYVGYWCEAEHSHCDGSIMWEKNISSPWKVWPTKENSKRQFGISLDMQGSSGINWADCAYYVKEKSNPPEPRVKKGSLSVELRPVIQCPAKSGYVYAYHVNYCPATNQQCSGPAQNFTVPRSGGATRVTLPSLQDGTTYLVWAYSITVAGELQTNAQSVQVTTQPGARSFIDTKPGRAAAIGISLLISLILFIVGVVCCCRKCREGCKRQFNILIKQPEKYPPKEVVSEDVVPQEYAVPYYNFTNTRSSGVEDAARRPSPETTPPALPARLGQYENGSNNDSGIGTLPYRSSDEPLAVSSPGIIAPNNMNFPNPMFITSAEYAEDQNVLNTRKSEENSIGSPTEESGAVAYRYAPGTFVLNNLVEDGPSMKGAKEDPRMFSLLDRPQGIVSPKNADAANLSSSSSESDRGEEEEEDEVSTDDQDISDGSAGYKPAHLSDREAQKSAQPLLSPQKGMEPTVLQPSTTRQPAGMWDLPGASGLLLAEQPTVPLGTNALLLLGVDRGSGGGEQAETCDGEDQEEGIGESSEDYGYASSSCVLRL